MKKFFEFIGLTCLMCFSFFYTEKTVSVVKELDEIMIKLEEKEKELNTDPINAIIKDNTIIPGISGKKINIKKSYKRLQKLGTYDESLLIYKKTLPDISIKNNYDKYIISGNKNNKNISLIFLVDNNDSIDNIIKIFKKHKLTPEFFIDGNWFENNNELVLSLINDGILINNKGYNNSYQSSSFIWMNTILKSVKKNNKIFCLKTNDNDLNKCALEKNYTISPTIVISNNPYINTEKYIQNGNIIAYEINTTLEKELDLIINKIKQKDINIVPLYKLIEE